MAQICSITLRVDGAALEQVVQDIHFHADSASPETFGQVTDLLFGVGDLGPELACVKVDADTTRAGEVVIRLEPTDRLCMALAALRAGDVDGL